MTEAVHALAAAPILPPRRAKTVPAWRQWLRRPGWPLTLMFVPFPLWWALGLAEWIGIILAIPMAVYLLRRRRIDVPRGFGFWLLFLLWVAGGVMVLQVSAAGAIPDASPTRYVTWFYRLLWYLAVTVAALYVLNTRRQLSIVRIARVVSVLFVTVVAGGLLGVIAPHLQFTSPVELLLPRSIRNVQFVDAMIHPVAAQLQDVLGFEAPRPSAPYSYTNTWGLNFVCTLPFFLYAWCGKQARWRRFVAPVILVVALIPVIYSVNRGMWIALGAMALFAAVRAAVTGKPALLGGVVVGAVALVAVVSLTSLGGLVNARLSNSGSVEGRTHLSTLAVTSVARTSPVIGLGSTRNVQGNFNSITGGATAVCPRCSPPALGTQGQLWLVVFSQGFVGLVLYMVFFGVVAWSALRRRTPEATMALAVLVASVVTMPVYNSLGSGLMVTMLAVAIAVRERLEDQPDHLMTLENYTVPVARWAALVAVCAILGLSLGDVVTNLRGTQYRAVTTIVLPTLPTVTIDPATDGPFTMDTLAQLVDSKQAADAVQKASGTRPVPGDGTIIVRAAPNSRTLNITYIADRGAKAIGGSRAAATALLALRQEQIDAERTTSVTALQARAEALGAGLTRLDTVIAQREPGKERKVPLWQTFTSRTLRTSMQTQLTAVDNELATVLAANAPAGRILGPTKLFIGSGPRRVDLATGLLTGLGVGLVLALASGRRGTRIGEHFRSSGANRLPVLAVIEPGDIAAELVGDARFATTAVRDLSTLETAVAVYDFARCVSADEDDTLLADTSVALEQVMTARRGTALASVIMARPGTRWTAVDRAARRSRQTGATPVGVIVVRRSRKVPTDGSRKPMLVNGRTGAGTES